MKNILVVVIAIGVIAWAISVHDEHHHHSHHHHKRKPTVRTKRATDIY